MCESEVVSPHWGEFLRLHGNKPLERIGHEYMELVEENTRLKLILDKLEYPHGLAARLEKAELVEQGAEHLRLENERLRVDLKINSGVREEWLEDLVAELRSDRLRLIEGLKAALAWKHSDGGGIDGPDRKAIEKTIAALQPPAAPPAEEKP